MNGQGNLWRAARLTLRHLLLAAAALAIAFPFYWMATSALKTNDEIWQFPPTLWPHEPLWGNFADAWIAAPFARYLGNSIFVAGTIVVLQIVNSGMMAYALTHMKFRLQGWFTAAVLVGYMVPNTAVYLPGYVILGELRLLDTYAGLIVSNCVSVFSIFLMRQAFLQVSHELVEAGMIDGASHMRILWTILAPLVRPSFAVLALIAFIEQYNNYFWPMLITKDPGLQLVSAGLRSFFVEGGAYGLRWPLIMAASAFTVAPLLALFALTQKTIIRSVNLAAGASKG